MKGFAVVALSGLAAMAVAQSTTVSLTPMESCALKCGDDICCRAACAKVPCPDDAMANRTTECSAKCSQGNGSPEDTKKYAECQASCVTSLFFPGTANLPAATPTNGSNGGSSGGNNAAQTNSAGQTTATGSSSGASASGSSSGTATGASASASATSTGLANSNVPLGSSAAGIVGLIMAALAL